MTLAFVPDDGYTEQGFVAEVSGLCPDIRFEYRPTRQEEREHLAERMRRTGSNAKAANRASYSFLAEKLCNWDLADKDGNAAPITTENVGKLKPFVFDRLFLIVSGQAASDPDPRAEADQDRELKIQLLMKEKSLTYSDAVAEIDQKNS